MKISRLGLSTPHRHGDEDESVKFKVVALIEKYIERYNTTPTEFMCSAGVKHKIIEVVEELKEEYDGLTLRPATNSRGQIIPHPNAIWVGGNAVEVKHKNEGETEMAETTTSSNILAVGVTPEDWFLPEEVFVIFKGENVYIYYDVQESLVLGMKEVVGEGESIGKFINKFLVNGDYVNERYNLDEVPVPTELEQKNLIFLHEDYREELGEE